MNTEGNLQCAIPWVKNLDIPVEMMGLITSWRVVPSRVRNLCSDSCWARYSATHDICKFDAVSCKHTRFPLQFLREIELSKGIQKHGAVRYCGRRDIVKIAVIFNSHTLIIIRISRNGICCGMIFLLDFGLKIKLFNSFIIR